MFFILFLIFGSNLEGKYLDLGSNNGEWRFCQSNYVKPCYKANRVPGDIFTDLYPIESSNENKSMLYGNNDQKFSWIGKESWTYYRNFSINHEILTVGFLLKV